MNVEFAPEISPEVNRRVRALLAALDSDPLPGVRDLVPAYRTLLVVYDPLVLPYEALLERLRGLERVVEETMPPSRTVTIPVAYGGELGPDLADVSQHTGMAEADVIARHSGGQYLVYFLGFSPGFPYLGGLDPALATPRLPTPRQRVPAGAVGIAGSQTGIYPQSTPGGWRLIGRTPVRLYDPTAAEPCLLRPGDELRFQAIGADEFAHLSEAVAEGATAPRSWRAIGGEGPVADKQGRAALRVAKAGLLTTVQDLGRYGCGRFGLPVAGALDECALRWANLIAGNPPDAAAIEMTFVGPALILQGEQPVVAALAGADFTATLNGAGLPAWRSFILHPGDTLALGDCRVGARGYLAVAGGIDVPLVFGSRAADMLGRIGGVDGRAVAAGDLLPLSPPAVSAANAVRVPASLLPDYGASIMVRVVLGPQDERFTEEAIATFLDSPYTVTRESDRMGMRLEGPALTFRDGAAGADILSEGVVTGAIQVPAHGKPIVLLAAHQTTGGYAKIATIAGADLWRLGQARPGDTVCFSAVTVEEAQEALGIYHARFDPAALVALSGVAASSASVTTGVTLEAEGGSSGMADHDRGDVPPAAGWSPAEVNALLDRIAALGLAEVVIETAGLRLELRREPAGTGGQPAAARATKAAAETATAATAAETTFTVTAPFVGVFYHGPRPGEPALVQPGDIVEPGQALGLIEVMKTFHEVTPGRRGRVVAFLVEDGAPVEYGQPLLTLEEAGGA